MECSIYQNYSASEVLVQSLAGVVNQQDVESMVRAQKKMLQRFEKTNEMLSNCNTLSATRFERAQRDFKAHTAQILEMKKDLDVVLRRIHNLKTKMALQNPEAFRAAGGREGPLPEEDDEYDIMIKEKKAQEAAKQQSDSNQVSSPTGTKPKKKS